MKTGDTALTGALFMMVACALFAATSLIAKSLGNADFGPALHPFQISAGRFFFAFLCLLPFLVKIRPSFQKVAWKLHIGRSVCGWLGVSALFAAATQMPLADATAISFLSPVVTMIFAILLLKEVVPASRWIYVALSFVGMALITRPGSDTFQPAALIAFASACFMGIEAIFIKKLADNDIPLRILVINNGIGATISVTIALTVWISPTTSQWALLALLGMVMVTGQTCFIQSMKRGKASFVAPFMYVTPVFAALYDYLLFGEIVSSLSSFGILLIISSAILQSKRFS